MELCKRWETDLPMSAYKGWHQSDWCCWESKGPGIERLKWGWKFDWVV